MDLTSDEMRQVLAMRARRAITEPTGTDPERLCRHIASQYEDYAAAHVAEDKSVNAAFGAAHFRAIAEGALICAEELRKRKSS